MKGTVSKLFEDKEKRMCYVLDLEKPVEIDGAEWDRVSLGNLAGFVMALSAAKIERLRVRDVLELECEDVKAPTKEGYSPRPNFNLKLTRA
ncbi:MAG TPA: hypothetical protein VKP61_08775 [Candidatus Acidoferrum sp.]|nr:hypothetical protein [Candidatus Acidoferrum sp.]